MAQENTNLSPKLKSRIAPTPSGWIHLGNAFSFVLTSIISNKNGADLGLRIDDLDHFRVREEFIEDIFKTLDWLGVTPDSGPSSVKEHTSSYSQSLRTGLYDDYLGKLTRLEVVFPCSCSRKEIMSLSPEGRYSGKCVDLPFLPKSRPEKTVALRLDTRKLLPFLCDSGTFSFQHTIIEREMPFFVVRRKDGLPSYQVASLVDDLHFGYNLIVRGEDLLASTNAQYLLAGLIGEQAFLESSFYHHPLVKLRNEKLSKSLGATDLREIRKKGSARAFYSWVAEHLGKNKKISSLKELTEDFELIDLANLPSSIEIKN